LPHGALLRELPPSLPPSLLGSSRLGSGAGEGGVLTWVTTGVRNFEEVLEDAPACREGGEGGREGGRGEGEVGKIQKVLEVGTYGCQNDGLDELDTMVGEEGREGGREGGMDVPIVFKCVFIARKKAAGARSRRRRVEAEEG